MDFLILMGIMRGFNPDQCYTRQENVDNLKNALTVDSKGVNYIWKSVSYRIY